MLKTSEVLNANKEMIIINFVKFNKWNDKDIKEMFKEKIEYYTKKVSDHLPIVVVIDC